MTLSIPRSRHRFWVAGTSLTAIVAIAAAAISLHSGLASAKPPQAVQATPVSVAAVMQSDVATWNDFSGRLEAVERVDIRSRVAGTVEAVHFREGALVKAGDLLLTIDPAPARPTSIAPTATCSSGRRAPGALAP